MKRKDCLMNSLGRQDFLTALIFLNSINLKTCFSFRRKGYGTVREIEHTWVSILAKYLFEDIFRRKISILSHRIRVCVPVIKTFNFGVILYFPKYTYSLHLFFLFYKWSINVKDKKRLPHIKDKMKYSNMQKNLKSI